MTYVGEVTVRLGREKAHAGTVIMLPPRYGETVTADVPVAAGRHWLELTYRFDDGIRWPASRPLSPWATLRFEEGRGAEGRGAGPPARHRTACGALARASRPPSIRPPSFWGRRWYWATRWSSGATGG